MRGDDARAAKLTWFDAIGRDTARLRHPDLLLLGAYDGSVASTLDSVASLESAIGVTFPIIQFSSAFGDKSEQQFPLAMVSAISEFGSVPLITWEPWLTDFESGRHPGLPLRANRDAHGLAAVAAGTYDFYVDR